MPQSLFHAFFCFSFPDLHVDVQGWNFQGADAAVLSLHIFGTCISRLLIGRNDGCDRWDTYATIHTVDTGSRTAYSLL